MPKISYMYETNFGGKKNKQQKKTENKISFFWESHLGLG